MASISFDFDVVIFAPLAPIIGVLVFWLIQLLFIENQKHMLSHLRSNHEPLCRFTNFVGILFQTMCHALGYTVTRSGIQHFQVTVNYGKVSPKKEKTGVFEWISNSFLFLGPFFIPSGLLLLCSYFLLENGFVIPTPTLYTFGEGLSNFGLSLSTYAQSFAGFLLRIDFLNPIHLGFFLLLLFLGMGIRPSYMGEEKKSKIDLMYDLKNIKNHFAQKPWYIVIFFIVMYGVFYLSLFLKTNWYFVLFSLFGWTSLVAIIAMMIAYLILLLIRTTDEISGRWKVLPFLTIPVSYSLARVFLYYVPMGNTQTSSLVVMILSTLLVTILLFRYKTNRFKTDSKMKHMRAEDGKKRTSKKRAD